LKWLISSSENLGHVNTAPGSVQDISSDRGDRSISAGLLIGRLCWGKG